MIDVSEILNSPVLRREARQCMKEELSRRRRSQTPPDFYGASDTLFHSESNEVIIHGPAGTGKSFSALWKLHYIAETVHGVRILIARKTRASLTESGLVTYEQHVLGQDHPLVAGGSSREHRTAYRYSNGSIIVTGGLDRVDKILSSEWDIVYIQQLEECSEQEWETLSTRLRNNRLHYQQMIGDCNPGPPDHWIQRRANKGMCQFLKSEHTDNPTLWDMDKLCWTERGAQYIERLKAMTGVRRQRLYEGLWVSVEGAIFERWSPERHVCPNFALEMSTRFKNLKKYRVVDFGYVRDHAFNCQWWVDFPEGLHWQVRDVDVYGPCLIMYREIYLVGETVPTCAKWVKRLSDGDGEFGPTICDHSPSDIAILSAGGIKGCVMARKEEIVTHFQRINDALDHGEILIMEDARVDPRTGRIEPDPELIREDLPRLPTCTIEEIPLLQWYQDRTGRISREVPMPGQADHGTKNIGYLLMTLRPQAGTQKAFQIKGW